SIRQGRTRFYLGLLTSLDSRRASLRVPAEHRSATTSNIDELAHRACAKAHGQQMQWYLFGSSRKTEENGAVLRGRLSLSAGRERSSRGRSALPVNALNARMCCDPAR